MVALKRACNTGCAFASTVLKMTSLEVWPYDHSESHSDFMQRIYATAHCPAIDNFSL